MFAVLRFPNFAVAAIATVGAFAGYVANAALKWPAPAALAVAFAVGGAVGLAADFAALKRLRAQGALTAAIGSIAVNLVLENVVRWFFGNEARSYDLPIARDISWGGLRIGPQQLESMAFAIAIMAAVFALLAFTRTGKAMRAAADNPDLARLKGIDPERVAMIATVVGMGLVGTGGMLIGLDTSIDPLTGFRVVLSIFAAAVLGGLGSIPGAVLGAFLIGIAEELSAFALSPSYKTAVGFAAIFFVLTLRPRGLLGEKEA
jgi:branched-chain amino acid transport system permease protein/neutral amino acid transport system permease protein